ncbi:TonB-dependent receptor [Aquimarina sp. AD10]|uniref:TonB-dependent receptor domain-containing protein n=1 Tax=Aquimarina sp. AD10 TaxID=1714849 RepID=UPI000E4D704A|nr:TonB-dependent receptor [Aquimarina sp. AD10]AXT63081.1 TonB-dependent receptor [Aquimarina sp. AD10]RKM96882.1 TonB-dependent receptor [Aquimarina sp. AD10]
MKDTIIIALLTLTSCLAYTQTYQGIVRDSQNKAIAYANVIVQNATDDSLITGVITDEEGKFNVSVKTDLPFVLLISFIGYENWKKQITIHEDTDLGIISLVESNNQLDEVVIRAEKKLIERKVDRLIFNVENSIAASGGDALDALKVAPRIRVQNDEISMIGKSGMRVLVNNKLIQLAGDDLSNFLKTIRTDDIKSIEVITNPPAKYAAEGNSGLININLKKAKLNSWNTSLRSSYQQATYPTGNVGVGFTYQKNKWSLFSDVNYSNGSIAPLRRNKISYPEQFWNERSNRRDYKDLIAYKLGTNYQISDKTSIGVQYIGNYGKPDIVENNRATLTNNLTQELDSLISTRARTNREKKYNSINTNFTYTIDSIGKILSVDIDFFKYQNNDNRNVSSNNFLGDGSLITDSFFSAQNIGKQDITNYSANLDMEHPLKNISLNYGGRLSFSETDNKVVFNDLSSGVSVFDPSQSDEFNYTENTQALYFSAHKNFGDKIEAKIGVRMENTEIKGQSIVSNQTNNNSYTEFFPTAYLSYVPSDMHTFSLNYGRRIDRPTFSWLNPFRWYSSNFSFSEGNPNLTPSFTHNIELDYTYNDNWINSLYFSSLEDGFEYVTIVDETTNTQRLFAQNFIKTNIIGLYEMISFEPFKGVSTSLVMNVYYSDSRSSIPVTNQSLTGWNLESYIGSDFVLHKDKKILFNVSYILASDGVDNLDRNTALSQLDASLKFFLLDKNLQITLSGNDILKSNQPEYKGFSNNLRTSFKNYYDTRNFRVSLVYNIGKKIDVEEREIKNEEEKDRIN